MREAFRKLGHEAWSCDLEPADDGSDWHFQDDLKAVLAVEKFDVLIAHPPCTCIAVSGNRWYADSEQREQGLDFVRWLMGSTVPRWCIENPISVISSRIRKPDQIIQPWQFGHGETKATCLWLKGLPRLKETNVVEGRQQRVWRMAPSPERARLRSETYQGIADAMAEQWGGMKALN